MSEIPVRSTASSPSTGPTGEDGEHRWPVRAWLGKASGLVATFFVGMVVNDLGRTGISGLTAVSALMVVAGAAFWIQGLDPQARLPRYAAWLFLVPAGCAAAAAFNAGTARIATILAIVLTAGAVLVVKELKSAVRLLVGVAVVTAGIMEIASGSALIAHSQAMYGIEYFALGAAIIAAGVAFIAGRRILYFIVIDYGAVLIVGGILAVAYARAPGAAAEIAAGAAYIAAGVMVSMAGAAFATGHRGLAWASIIAAGTLTTAGGVAEITQGRSQWIAYGIAKVAIGLACTAAFATAIVVRHRIPARTASLLGRRRLLVRTTVISVGAVIIITGTALTVAGVALIAGAVVIIDPEVVGYTPATFDVSRLDLNVTGAACIVSGTAIAIVAAATATAGVAIIAGRRKLLARATAVATGVTAIVIGTAAIAMGATVAVIGVMHAVPGQTQTGLEPVSIGIAGFVAGAAVSVAGAAIVVGRRRFLARAITTAGRRILVGLAVTATGILEIAVGTVDIVQNQELSGGVLILASVVIIGAGAAFTIGHRVLTGVAAIVAGVAVIVIGILDITGSQKSILAVGIAHGQVLAGMKDITCGLACIAGGAVTLDVRSISVPARRVIEWATAAPQSVDITQASDSGLGASGGGPERLGRASTESGTSSAA